jgi:hypothetical protein
MKQSFRVDHEKHNSESIDMTSVGMRTTAWITMAVGILTTYLLFMFRYNWYTTPSQAYLLNFGFVSFAVLCCLTWFARPSKTLVLMGYVVLFASPSIYDTHFVALDLSVLPFLVIGSVPLAAAIEMRRRTWQQKER